MKEKKKESVLIIKIITIIRGWEETLRSNGYVCGIDYGYGFLGVCVLAC